MPSRGTRGAHPKKDIEPAQWVGSVCFGAVVSCDYHGIAGSRTASSLATTRIVTEAS